MIQLSLKVINADFRSNKCFVGGVSDWPSPGVNATDKTKHLIVTHYLHV